MESRLKRGLYVIFCAIICGRNAADGAKISSTLRTDLRNMGGENILNINRRHTKFTLTIYKPRRNCHYKKFDINKHARALIGERNRGIRNVVVHLITNIFIVEAHLQQMLLKQHLEARNGARVLGPSNYEDLSKFC